MIARLSAWLVAALLGGALVAGCGSSSSSSTSASQTVSTAAAAAAGPTSAAAAPTSAAGPTSTGGVSSASSQQAVCQQIVHAAPTLSSNVKAKLEGVCKKSASGDQAGARQAAEEVCVEIIKAYPVPTSIKERALAACRTEIGRGVT
jgi:hypothetical protein